MVARGGLDRVVIPGLSAKMSATGHRLPHRGSNHESWKGAEVPRP